ncbi:MULTISPECIES: hypothetical protein [unclassified Leucobacter]|nr:hypothetical protein [Leucobacter sp. Ag1]
MMRRRNPGWSRGIAAILSLGMLTGLAVGTPAVLRPQPVAAAWTDQENGKATITAGTVPNPTNLTCTLNGLLGAVASITLTWKTTVPPPATFRIGIVAGANGTPTSGNVTATPTLVSGTQDTYTATIPVDLLTSLLTSLLGSTATLGVSGTAGSNWVSPGWARAEVKIVLLGLLLGSSCTPL